MSMLRQSANLNVRGAEQAQPYRPTLLSRDLIPMYLRGIQINGALYLAAVIFAGVITRNAFAWQPAIVAAGAAYLSYTCLAVGYHASTRWTFWGQVFAVVSVLLALAAGVAILL